MPRLGPIRQPYTPVERIGVHLELSGEEAVRLGQRAHRVDVEALFLMVRRSGLILFPVSPTLQEAKGPNAVRNDSWPREIPASTPTSRNPPSSPSPSSRISAR